MLIEWFCIALCFHFCSLKCHHVVPIVQKTLTREARYNPGILPQLSEVFLHPLRCPTSTCVSVLTGTKLSSLGWLCVIIGILLSLTGVSLHLRCLTATNWCGFSFFQVFHCCTLLMICIISSVKLPLTAVVSWCPRCPTAAYCGGFLSSQLFQWHSVLSCIISGVSFSLIEVAQRHFWSTTGTHLGSLMSSKVSLLLTVIAPCCPKCLTAANCVGSMLSQVSHFSSLMWLWIVPGFFLLPISVALHCPLVFHCHTSSQCIIPGVSLPLTRVVPYHAVWLIAAHWSGSESHQVFDCQ